MSRPSAARPACGGSTRSGSATMQAMSAIATCAIMATTSGPPRRRESTIGRTRAADDDASEHDVQGSMSGPEKQTDAGPDRHGSRCGSRGPAGAMAEGGTDQRIPHRNMGSGHKHHQRKPDVGQQAECRIGRVHQAQPASARSAIPASSSPSTTGSRQRTGSASRGPARAATEISARDRNVTACLAR